jgi:chromosome segregation ATPase
MKREFLKSLGIEDKDIIDKILDENSSDIGRAKGELQTYKDKVTELEGKLSDKDAEISTLTAKANKIEGLEQENAQLKVDNSNLTNDLNTKVSEIKKNHAIENGVRDAKARNVKAVLAQLDMSKITFDNDQLSGLTEQLESLKTGEDTSFLFGEAKSSLAGTHRNTPNSNGGANPPTSATLADAVAKALSKGQN